MKLLLFLIVSVCCWSTVQGDGHVITASFSGDQLDPPVNSTASGTVTFLYSEATDSIMYAMDLFNPDGVTLTSVNIHCASGTDGDNVVVTLFDNLNFQAPAVGTVGQITEGDIRPGQCVIAISALWAFMTSSQTYVVVSSRENESGEIRATLPGSESGEVVGGDLTGDAVVPPVNSTVAGTAHFIYSSVSARMAYAIDIANPDELELFGGNNGASLHCGSITPSNIIVDLVAAGNTDTSTSIGVTGFIRNIDLGVGTGSRCVSTVENLWVFMKTNSMTYVTIDSTDNPGGEVRANLMLEITETPGPTQSPTDTSTSSPTLSPTTTTAFPSMAPAPSPPTAAGATLSIAFGLGTTFVAASLLAVNLRLL